MNPRASDSAVIKSPDRPAIEVAMKICLTWIVLLLFAVPISAQPVVDPSDLDMDGKPGVAEVPAIANEQIPSVLVGTGTLLIDRSHGNGFNVGGFTSYLSANGWVVSDFTVGPITESALDGIDVLMVPTRSAGLGPIFPFSTAEVAAVQSFLSKGKGLWVLHDNDDPSGVNTLSTSFGVTFRYDFVRDPSNNEGELYWPTVYLLGDHPVMEGVTSYGYYLGDCLTIETPASMLAQGDNDAYSLYCPAGTLPSVMAAWQNSGRALFAGDITTLHPSYYPSLLRAEEQLLLQNIANWLLGPPPNAVETETWGRVKARFR